MHACVRRPAPRVAVASFLLGLSTGYCLQAAVAAAAAAVPQFISAIAKTHACVYAHTENETGA